MGTRPGRIKGEFEVPFERPRSLAVKRAPAFLATCDQIAGLIDNEAARINVVSTD
jgi:ABC-type nitrate/sulfonate/bicarbonate transport system ATPase subunit